MKQLLGIYREPECSPGRHRSNDTLLLDAIAADLRDRGARVTLIAPDWNGPSAALTANAADAELIF